jgi:O-antigen polymerase
MRSTQRLLLLAASVSYIGLLHLAYVYLTVPYFSYVGLYFSPISDGVVLWSWFIVLLPVAWMPLSTTRPSIVVYYLLYALVIVPACTVPAYTGALAMASLIKMQISLLVCFGLLGLVYLIPLLTLPRIRLSKMVYFVILGLLTCASYLTIVHFVGLSFRFPNPLNVYGVRDDFNELTANINSRWLGYCTNWQSFVINPIFLAYGLLLKKYYIVGFALAGQLAIYALGGLKMVLFSSILAVALLVIQKVRCFGVSFLWSAALFVASCMVCDQFILHTEVGLTSLFVRRLVFLPGQLTGMFFEFFSSNRFALLGHSVLKGLVSYPYSLEPPYLIGETYFSHDKMAADANLWADGFANFGYFGMLAATFVLGCWIWLVDSSSINRNKNMIMLMVGVPSVVLANCGLLTSIGNHGLGLTLVLIYLLPWDFCLVGAVSPPAYLAIQPKRPQMHAAGD